MVQGWTVEDYLQLEREAENWYLEEDCDFMAVKVKVHYERVI